MRMYDIITKKKHGQELSKEEIYYFISEYVKGEIPDYQVSALLMAIYFKGLNKSETYELTRAMIHSGDTVDLSSINGIKVDKHSTGGVADTTTLIAAPLAAACGATIAKMSGRGLGHTGGTLDKLETIEGFNVNMTKEDFFKAVNKTNLAVIGQTNNLVPADKKLYALRDVTSTVDNLSLIASSIMSKKIASGANALVLDVKTGNGAFLKTVKDSTNLAKEMVDIGTKNGIMTAAIISDMNQPLGNNIGNSLEVKEAVEILSGKYENSDLAVVSINLAAHMLLVSGKCRDIEEGNEKIYTVLADGRGKKKLKEMVLAQGGNEKVIDDTSLLPQAKKIIDIPAQNSGYINKIDTENVGICSVLLGAGRTKKEDNIDNAVGIVLKARLGSKIKKGECIAQFHVNSESNLGKAINLFNKSIIVEKMHKQLDNKLIYGVVTKNNVKLI